MYHYPVIDSTKVNKLLHEPMRFVRRSSPLQKMCSSRCQLYDDVIAHMLKSPDVHSKN
ncbi:unnamed protein product [Penicillium roqueforti FM164]|uniref:Genomic scaffold, ProqFM164S02 n=1 Tax=Penicillium roqueforti (strain FM164) TaxID=1365484 RepID=W6Q5I6_PENRF|nr:unnamed protein product [Penicillium roqueforti FM164]